MKYMYHTLMDPEPEDGLLALVAFMQMGNVKHVLAEFEANKHPLHNVWCRMDGRGLIEHDGILGWTEIPRYDAKQEAPFFCTFTGVKFNLADPQEDMIRKEDIAHHLSQINRFGGATSGTYNVAHHSVLVAALVYDWTDSPAAALQALYHDAAEAYWGDLVRGAKQMLPWYRAMEDRTLAVVYRALGIQTCQEWKEITKSADDELLHAERRDFMPAVGWWETPDSSHQRLISAGPGMSKTMFLAADGKYRSEL